MGSLYVFKLKFFMVSAELCHSEVISQWHGRKSSIHVLLDVPGRGCLSQCWHHRADLVLGLLGFTVRRPCSYRCESIPVSLEYTTTSVTPPTHYLAENQAT